MSANSSGWAGIGDRNKRVYYSASGACEWIKHDGGAYFAPTDDIDHYTLHINVSHTHSVTAEGTVSSSFTGTDGTTSSTSPTFTGTAGTTGSSGSGTSFSILLPYVVKYCFERTA